MGAHPVLSPETFPASPHLPDTAPPSLGKAFPYPFCSRWPSWRVCTGTLGKWQGMGSTLETLTSFYLLIYFC